MNRNAKFIQTKSQTHEIVKVNETTYNVISGKSNKTYNVTMHANGKASCTCDFGKYNNNKNGCGCSHTVSVFNFIAETTEGRKVSAWASEEAANRQHRPTLNIGTGLILTTRKMEA